MPERVTRRLPGGSIEFVDGKGYAKLNQNESVKLLFARLADCEDELDERATRDKARRERLQRAYLDFETSLYNRDSDKPIEIQAALAWGALMMLAKTETYTWDEVRMIFGEFMSKKLNLR